MEISLYIIKYVYIFFFFLKKNKLFPIVTEK